MMVMRKPCRSGRDSDGERDGQKQESGKKSRVDRYAIDGNLVVDGHRTSVRLEPEMWAALKEVAKCEDCTVNELASLISRRRNVGQNFTSAIRVYLMMHYRKARR